MALSFQVFPVLHDQNYEVKESKLESVIEMVLITIRLYTAEPGYKALEKICGLPMRLLLMFLIILHGPFCFLD